MRLQLFKGLLVFAFVFSTQLQAKDIIFAISAKPTTLHGATAEDFANRLQKKLGKKHKVKFYHSGQLGKDKDLMQKVKLGTVHLTQPSSTMVGIVPEYALFDMPFMIKDRTHIKKVEKEIFWKHLVPKTKKKGYTMLGFWENGIRHISNNKRPIFEPADLKGVKIRTPKSSWRVAMFKNWGAAPTPMAFPEVFVALQTGVIDGQENPLGTIWGGKLQEVQKYVSITGHVYIPAYLATGNRTWKKLPKEVKMAIKEAAEEVKPAMYAKGEENDKNLISKLASYGTKVNIANRKAFVESSQPVYDKFIREVPAAKMLIDKTLELAQ